MQICTERAGSLYVGFSALQRAENSSIFDDLPKNIRVAEFQCSSASRKFLNARRPACAGCSAPVSVLFSEPKIPQFGWVARVSCAFRCFSALQRAENSSMLPALSIAPTRQPPFQCSSASRKFLNVLTAPRCRAGLRCFSALQRAENSSIIAALRQPLVPACFSALQRAENSSITSRACRRCYFRQRFSALQRAENSSITI